MIRIRIALFIIVSLLLTKPVQARTIVTLHFNDSATVSDSVFYLRDIAEINAPTMIINQLSETIAGKSAPPGFQRFLNSADLVSQKISPLFPNCEFSVTGPSRSIIITDHISREIADFEKEIRAYLNQNLRWSPEQWRATILNPHDSLKLLPSSYNTTLDGLKNPQARGTIQLLLTITQGKTKTAQSVQCLIQVDATVLVSKRDIIRGESLTADNCTTHVADLTRFGPEPIFSFDELTNKVSTRAIPAGTTLYSSLVRELPVIQRGDPVMISVERGRVRVGAAGVAREHGAIGEIIWVQNEMSKKLLRVKVIGKGNAIIPNGESKI